MSCIVRSTVKDNTSEFDIVWVSTDGKSLVCSFCA